MKIIQKVYENCFKKKLENKLRVVIAGNVLKTFGKLGGWVDEVRDVASNH